jgi:hypothetical protein
VKLPTERLSQVCLKSLAGDKAPGSSTFSETEQRTAVQPLPKWERTTRNCAAEGRKKAAGFPLVWGCAAGGLQVDDYTLNDGD